MALVEPRELKSVQIVDRNVEIAELIVEALVDDDPDSRVQRTETPVFTSATVASDEKRDSPTAVAAPRA